MLEVNIMKRAKLFINGRSQAVRLPKEYQFSGNDVIIQKVGDAVILLPNDKSWEVFLHGLNNFSDDFMKEGRDQGENQKRELDKIILKPIRKVREGWDEAFKKIKIASDDKFLIDDSLNLVK